MPLHTAACDRCCFQECGSSSDVGRIKSCRRRGGGNVVAQIVKEDGSDNLTEEVDNQNAPAHIVKEEGNRRRGRNVDGAA